MSKVRVYEVAKQLGIDEQAALALLQQQGAPVRNRLSAVEQDVADRAKRALERSKAASVVEERIRPTVVRRKATPRADEAAPVSAPGSVSVGAVSGRTNGEADTHPADLAPIDVRPVERAEPVRRVERREEPAQPSREPAHREAVQREAVQPRRETPHREPKAEKKAVEKVEAREHPEPVAAVETPVAERPAAVERVAEPEPRHEEPAPTPVVVEVQREEPAAPAAEPVREEPAHAAPAHEPEVVEYVPEAPVETAAAEPTSTGSGQSVRPPPKTGIETWAGRPGVPMPQPVQSRSTTMRGPLGGASGNTMQRRGVQYDPRRDASPPGRPMGGGIRPGMPGQRPGMGGRPGIGGASGMKGRGAGPATLRRPGPAPGTAEMAAHKKVIKIDEKVTLASLAARMSLKATDVLMKLMQMGMSGVNINTTLDSDTAKILAGEFGWSVEDVAFSEADQLKEVRGEETVIVEDTDLELRPPVVTVMGHVDHGKTSLLDRIRKTTVAAGEAGGITQHIGAYRVKTSRGDIAFLDTPGHAAFTQMRARGAQVTDIVVLVVAADDGVMPQTREAVAHARAAKVPIVVAVNKVDKPEADPQRPRRELMELELVPEELGGDTMFVDVSAKTGQGIEMLLESLALQAEVLELRANEKKPGTGTVIEAMLDRGKGPVARILVRDGTLRVGDFVLAGPAFGKVRAMTDEHGRAVPKAGPSTPVEVLGLSDVPNAGDSVDVVKDPRKAQELADQRKAKVQRSIMPQSARVSLEDLATRAAQSGQLELRLVIKADVQGSVEAVADSLQKLTGEKVKVTVVHSAVGAITEGDVNLATASKAIVIGFNVRPAGKAQQLADTEGVQIRLYNIIYNAVDDVKKAMEGLLAPTIVEKFLGRAEVRQAFNISKVGMVAGCMVVDGTMKRAASKVRLIRDSAVVWEGKIGGLRHIKEDKREIEKGFECGISLDNYSDIKPGDFIECYDVEEVAATL
ncbi:MAG: translation initiation factor IF-2 [Myxococcales bacterium]|nr:translation initiation factor IF-2 [Myxococcales bacterium]